METKRDCEIRRAVQALREYFAKLVDLEYEQTDIADKLPFEKMEEEIAMAIYNLESQLGKEKEKPVRLITTVWAASAIEKFHTNYLPGSTCYVLQDNEFYILNKNHKWVKIYEE